MRPSCCGNVGTSLALFTVPRARARAITSSRAAAPTIGLVKNEPALCVLGSFGSTTIALARRRRITVSRTSPSVAPAGTLLASSAYARVGAPPAVNENVTSVTTNASGSRLKRLSRYANAQSAAGIVTNVSRARSKARTSTMVLETSCPYAPTFWIGVAPTRPGMPLRHSMPARPRATVSATSSSHGSPARTVQRVPSRIIPRVAIAITRPSNPSSGTTRFDPPPRMPTRTFSRRAHASAWTRSSSVTTSAKRFAAPPSFSVVRGASATFSRISTRRSCHALAVAPAFGFSLVIASSARSSSASGAFSRNLPSLDVRFS